MPPLPLAIIGSLDPVLEDLVIDHDISQTGDLDG